MNQKKFVVKRKVGKIDELFSYIGGLFSSILLMLSFFISNYNKFKFEIKTGQSFVGNNPVFLKSPFTYKKFTFIKYCKYTIYRMVKKVCCCYQLQWEDCKQIDHMRD